MRPIQVEVARALIARVKAADSSINRRDELWRASDSDAFRTGEIGTVCRFASAVSLRMGDGPVTEWIARLLRPEQAYKAAVLRNDALRVVLEWLRSELPWYFTWAPVLGSLHRWQQVWTPRTACEAAAVFSHEEPESVNEMKEDAEICPGSFMSTSSD